MEIPARVHTSAYMRSGNPICPATGRHALRVVRTSTPLAPLPIGRLLLIHRLLIDQPLTLGGDV